MKFRCLCNHDMSSIKNTKVDSLQKFEDNLGNVYEEFVVTRDYKCKNHCGRELSTIERECIYPQITILKTDAKEQESFFQPDKYKNSLKDALDKEDNVNEKVRCIYHKWLHKCDDEKYEKKYIYNIEELIDFTVKELISQATKESAIRWILCIDVDLIEKYKELQ